VTRCATVGGEPANLCFLGRPLAERSGLLARFVALIENLRDAATDNGDPVHLARLGLEAAISASGAATGEVYLPELFTEPVEASSDPSFVARSGTPGSRDLRLSFFGCKLPAQYMPDGVPLLAAVRELAPEPSDPERRDLAGIYICAPVVSDGATVGSVGIYGESGQMDTVTALRALSAVAEVLGGRVSDVGEVSPQPASNAGDAKRYDRARLRIHILGPLRVQLDGEELSVNTFRRSRSVSLLKLLATGRRQPVSRALLREMFWPNEDGEKTAASLRSVLHDLRRSLKPANEPVVEFIVSQRGMVGLDTSDLVWVDAEEMDRKVALAHKLATQGRVGEAVREYVGAAALFDNDPLFADANTNQDGWWSHSRAVTLQGVYDSAILGLARLTTQQGQALEASKVIRETIERDPSLGTIGRHVTAEVKRLV
jgi:DNA-binding SARP family transcriptional activator